MSDPRAEAKFPPQPADAQRGKIDLLRLVFRSVLSPREAIYVAGPITGGLLRVPSAPQLDRESGVAANVEKGMKAAARIRASSSRLVVQPFSLKVPDWTQNDYITFWSSVVEEFAHTVVLLNNWEFSNGSAYEFLTAVRCRRQIQDPDLVEVKPETALHRLKQANLEAANSGRFPTFTTFVANEVECLIDRA